MVGAQTIRLDTVGSTNSYIRQLLAADNPVAAGLVVTACSQTAGRGQRGNSWEASPGLNITMSVLLAPTHVAPAGQFAISEAVALAVADTADCFLPSGMRASVKWPNDIYVGQQKLAGILIEHIVSGSRLLWSICGIGLNVNQPAFESDAPNPVSLRQLAAGAKLDLGLVERTLIDALAHRCDRGLGKAESRAALHNEYMERLWRGNGEHVWLDRLDGTRVTAAIDNVAPTGHLTLRLTDGSRRTYAFKEVAAVINDSATKLNITL